MMAGKPVGTMFAEMDLDLTPMEKKLKLAYDKTVEGTQKFEAQFQQLGIKSDRLFESQKQMAIASYESIKKSATSTANDIIRAEEAKNAKIKQLNDQQYGAHLSLTDKIKQNWVGLTVGITAAFAAFHSAARFTDVIKQVLEAQDAMVKMTEKTGASFEMLKVLSYGAQLADTDIQAVAKGLGILAKNMQGAAIDMDGAGKSFKALGIETVDSSGKLKSMDSIIMEVADRFAEMENGTGKTAYAMALFGKSGKDLIPLLNEGSAGFAEMKAEMEALGFSFDEAGARKAEALNDNLKRLEMASDNLKKQLVMEMVPSLLNLSEAFIKSKKEGQGTISIVETFGTVFKGAASFVVGLAAAFDMTGTAMGMAAAKYAGYLKWFAAPITAPVGIYKMLTAQGPSIIDEMKKKAESYGSAIDSIWNKTTNAKIKFGKTGDDAPLLDKKGGADTYANTLRQITDETTAWQTKIAELDPYLSKEDNQILKLTNDSEVLIKKLQDQAGKEGIDVSANIAKIRAGLEQGIESINTSNWLKGQEEYEKMMSEEAEYGMNENERAANAIIAKEEMKMNKLKDLWWEGKITEEEYNEAETRIHSNTVAAKLDKDTEYARKIAGLNYDSIQGIIGMEEQAFHLKMELIDAEAARRVKDGADAVMVAIQTERKKADAVAEYGRKSNSVTAGISAAWYDLYKNQMTWGEASYRVMVDWYGKMGDAVGDGLFDVLTGDLENLSDLWDDTWKSMLKTLTKTIGKMVTEAAIKDIVLLFKSEWTEEGSNVLGIVNSVLGFAGSLFGGGGDSFDAGLYSGGWVPGYAYGGNSPANDTVRAMLSPGEYVVDRETIAGMGRNGDSMIAHINPVEAALLKAIGGSGTINPRTGLPEFFTSEGEDTYVWTQNGLKTVAEAEAENYPTLPLGAVPVTYTKAQLAAAFPLDMGPVPILGGRYNIADGSLYWDSRAKYNAYEAYVSTLRPWQQTFFHKNIDYRDPRYANVAFAQKADGTVVAVMTENKGTAQQQINWVQEDPTLCDLAMWEVDPKTGAASNYQYYDAERTSGNEYAPYFIAAGALLTGGMLAPLAAGSIAGGAALGAGLGASTSALNQQLATGNIDWGSVAISAGVGGATGALGGWLSGDKLTVGTGMNSATVAHEAATAEGVGALIAEAAEQYPSTWAGSIYDGINWGGLIDTGLDAATKMVFKQALKYAINSTLGGGEASNDGQMKISYEGANDSGLLASLAAQQQGLAGTYRFPFSAANGLDYVPYDNFLINAHKGEAVITADENKDRLAGTEVLYQIAKNTGKMAKILSRFDDTGLPAERSLV